ncbi:Phosphatidylinositol-4-phosphate 5-kinase, core [Dillenia turbinata]|uniref:1-phosphatidylinositol-4-phosphate 5-kinase n=1 Tax=Dillenia turbinata TaxID=194707 RepID=A0AAN8WFE0_9MAGN
MRRWRFLLESEFLRGCSSYQKKVEYICLIGHDKGVSAALLVLLLQRLNNDEAHKCYFKQVEQASYPGMEDGGRVKEVHLNGDIYCGSFKGLLPHGRGKYTWSDGTIYEGEWEEGRMTGKGQIIWPSGATYEGDFSGDFLHGFGTFTAADGSNYRGAWRLNIQHGLGRKQYSNSDIYEGFWKEGVHEGRGRYDWNNGNAYTGKWKGGKMCGRGVMRWANGDIYDGFWLDGFRHGVGFYKYADGGYYFGTWTRGLKDGLGTFYPTGCKYPPVHRWCSSLGCKDNRERVLSQHLSEKLDYTAAKPTVRCSDSDKSFVGGSHRSSSRISHRAMPFDENFGLYDSSIELSPRSSSLPSQAFDDEKNEVQHDGNLIYEREYVQGVLMKERIKREKEPPQRSTWRCTLGKKRVRTKSCVDIFEGHRSCYLMLNLQLGIRYTVGKITPVPMREVRSSDFGTRARIRMYFPRKGSQFTPPHYSIDFYWKDYCPMVFRNLRGMFKLDPADYMMSICGDDGLRELSSPGKSGSIFYLSHDDKFVIKTLKRQELKVLLRMLPAYYDHVRDYEHTLLTKFFGVHKIKLKGGRKVRFVIMGNMFCTDLRIHRRYDLKGSSYGRYTNENDIDENTTLKDLDLAYEFHMDKSLRESLFKQISVDCMFLESLQIIDYSLLLGLHFRAPEHLKLHLELPDLIHNPENSHGFEGATSHGVPGRSRSFLLVTHEPSFVSTAPGPHARGATLRAFSAGDREVDLLLPGTGRVRVQLGVNMPAHAKPRLGQDETDLAKFENFEGYDVVLYLGIIDILQEYNLKKKLEHTYKSLRLDPQSISAVEPKLYSRRFIDFLEKVFPSQP